MAHELETFANGQTAFASARISAWHQLGTVTQNTMSANEIMSAALLGNWGVRTIPIHGTDIDNGIEIPIPAEDRRMTVRRNPITGTTEYLGIVGTDYEVIQNEQCAEMLDQLVDQVGGAHFETAGSLRKGKSVFVTMKLPTTMQIGGVDRMDLYLIGTTSHDGTAALRLDASPIRVVCANTQRAAFAHAVGHYTFRHTSNVGQQITQAREALGLMSKYMDAFENAAERMLHTAITTREFEKIVTQVWPLPDTASDKTKANARERLGTLKYLITEADTQKAIAGSRWAGYQAITEYLDHYQHAKDATTRAHRVITGKTGDLKQAAFDLLAV